jgi:hypothetical protein
MEERAMKVGTRSLLFGSHQFLLHPIFVALAWRRLYKSWPHRFPTWVAFVVHDWGYWGLRDMDGADGVMHPRGGARIMHRLFDRDGSIHWYQFTATHSRSYAQQIGAPCSSLMRADKLATAMMPNWLYVALCWLSGEWKEYHWRWMDAGTYPGSGDDGVWEWSRHLQANWARFRDVDAVAGRAFGGE